MFNVAVTLVAFGAGTLVGSFLNVVTRRYVTYLAAEIEGINIKKLDIVWERSHCPDCHEVLRWWELLPLLSYLALRGRCARCQARISPQYPLLELVTGIVFVVLAGMLPGATAEWVQLFALLGVASLLIVLGTVDYYTFLLPDVFLIILSVFVILYLVFSARNLQPALYGVLIGSGFLLLLWLLTRGQGIGLGDVKLMVPLGALFAIQGTITLLFLAFFVGGIVGLFLLWRGRVAMKTAIPFGPFLTAAALLLLLWPSLPEKFFNLLLG